MHIKYKCGYCMWIPTYLQYIPIPNYLSTYLPTYRPPTYPIYTYLPAVTVIYGETSSTSRLDSAL